MRAPEQPQAAQTTQDAEEEGGEAKTAEAEGGEAAASGKEAEAAADDAEAVPLELGMELENQERQDVHAFFFRAAQMAAEAQEKYDKETKEHHVNSSYQAEEAGFALQRVRHATSQRAV